MHWETYAPVMRKVCYIPCEEMLHFCCDLSCENLEIKRDLPSRCLIVILPRHQSGTKELHEKHAHAYLVSLESGSVSRRKSRNEGETGGITALGPGFLQGLLHVCES